MRKGGGKGRLNSDAVSCTETFRKIVGAGRGLKKEIAREGDRVEKLRRKRGMATGRELLKEDLGSSTIRRKHHITEVWGVIWGCSSDSP